MSTMKEISFENKKVIVTGGCGGIGTPVVEGVVNGGGQVYLIYNSKPEAAKKLANRLGEDRVFPVQINLSDSNSIRENFQKILDDAHDIDVLINIAGIVSTMPFDSITQDEWERVIGINLNAVYACCQSVFSHMTNRGSGRIVNVSSVAGKVGGGLLGTAAYAASKAGVNALTKAIAKEGGPYGVCCNSICPSLTRTSMTTSMDPEKWNKIVNIIPLKRCAEPEEIANVILFYASDLASFCNGEITDVDGGIVLDG